MKILIYGGGAVGLGLASCLLKANVEVEIIARENTVRALNKYGLRRNGIFGEYHAAASEFQSYSTFKNFSLNSYDYIFVCVKSFDSVLAAKDLSDYKNNLKPTVKIVLFQNGWGNAEQFIEFFNKEQIYNARVITGFTRPKENEVKITVHADAIHLGSLFEASLEPMEALADLITSGGVPTEVTNAVSKDLWAKMIYNCALNPLGAIFEVPYGVLGEYEETRLIMKGIIEEIYRLFKVSGFSTHWQKAEEYLNVFYEKLLPPTAGHESSTLQDIRRKRRTEIGALNGAVVSLAQQYQIEVSFNTMILNMLKFLEARNFQES